MVKREQVALSSKAEVQPVPDLRQTEDGPEQRPDDPEDEHPGARGAEQNRAVDTLAHVAGQHPARVSRSLVERRRAPLLGVAKVNHQACGTRFDEADRPSLCHNLRDHECQAAILFQKGNAFAVRC